MIITRSHTALALLSALVATAGTGCRDSSNTAQQNLPAAPTVTASVLPAAPTALPAKADTSPVSWLDLKDKPFDQRTSFLAGSGRLVTTVDGQITELSVKRATLKSDTNTADWDFAMKEMSNSRSALQSSVAEAQQATAVTWSQQKERVGVAWVRTQDAVAKVKASTTH